jgi:hypothetical protein
MGAAKELRRRVAVPNEDGELVWYGPGDKVPAAVAKQITNPAAWAEGDSDADDTEDEEEVVPYAKRKKADLESEVAARNEGRDEADLIEVGKGTVADLAAALEADDAAQAEQV